MAVVFFFCVMKIKNWLILYSKGNLVKTNFIAAKEILLNITISYMYQLHAKLAFNIL
jgi:hypothetical protein